MAKRKSNTEVAEPIAGPSTTIKSTLIEDLNALNHDDFKNRFLNGPTLTQHEHNNTRWNASLYFAKDLPSAYLHQQFELIKTTSKHDYEPSSFGWLPQRKKREMKEPEMRYIRIEKNEYGGQFGGFISFMFTHDSSPAVPVLYIYEIHLTEATRGKGLGGFLMRLVDGIAKDAGVEKVMLTCFLSNENALAFYRKWGFEVDVCSPGDRTTRNKVVKADYVIMSKEMSEWEDDSEDVADEVTQAVPGGESSLDDANTVSQGNFKRLKPANSTMKKCPISFNGQLRPEMHEKFKGWDSIAPPQSNSVAPASGFTTVRPPNESSSASGFKVLRCIDPSAASDAFEAAAPATALESQKAKIQRLESQLKLAEQSNRLMTIDVREKEETILDLKAVVKTVQQARKKASSEARMLISGMEDGANALTLAAENSLLMQATTKAFRKALDKAEEAREEAEEERDDLQGQLDDAEQEKNDLEEERDELQTVFDNAIRLKDELEIDRDQWRGFSARRGVMIAELQGEVEELREALEEEEARPRTINHHFHFR